VYKNLRIIHIITSLEANGAQLMMLRLIEQLKRQGFSIKVISLTSKVPLLERFESIGIKVSVIDFSRFNIFYNLYLLLIEISNFKPSIVQTWMYHADLLGGFISKILGIKKIFWNIRHSDIDHKGMKITTIVISRICAFTSYFIPDKIISNSYRAIQIHKSIGYCDNKFIYIPNGFAYNKSGNSNNKYLDLRSSLYLSKSDIIVGSLARYHNQKDYPNLLKSAREVLDYRRDIHFVLCGNNVNYSNIQLTELINKLKINKNIHLLDYQKDIQNILTQLDLLVSSSSYGEGFPNVIGEAMLMGTPCISTDVGDSRLIIRDDRFIVPPSNSKLLSQAILNFISLSSTEKIDIGIRGNKIIIDNYSLKSVLLKYLHVYHSL
tara:strand:- start:17550 stop:18683 length:1134 start_codon:yes stop_codon:yes gene_type:complete